MPSGETENYEKMMCLMRMGADGSEIHISPQLDVFDEQSQKIRGLVPFLGDPEKNPFSTGLSTFEVMYMRCLVFLRHWALGKISSVIFSSFGVCGKKGGLEINPYFMFFKGIFLRGGNKKNSRLCENYATRSLLRRRFRNFQIDAKKCDVLRYYAVVCDYVILCDIMWYSVNR